MEVLLIQGEIEMVATTLITGTVAGFVLVIDPNNEKGKKERIKFQSALEMNAKQRPIWLQEVESKQPPDICPEVVY